MDKKAMYNIGYGLYTVTAAEGGKDNGCIANTVIQITSNPNIAAVCINHDNLTNEMIKKSKKFNISILDKNSPFDLFKHFGYQTGRKIDKFADWKDAQRSKNGILYLTKNTNSYISIDVRQEIEFSTHTMFTGEVTDAECLSDVPSVTYEYYQNNIKPKPQKTEKHGWRCRICGYIYEGENLPDDFICPLCRHGAADFERI